MRTHGVKGTLAFGSSGSTNRKLCSYILQEDYLQPLFTVHEIMLMACDLKVSSDSLNRSEKLRLVDKILDTLQLSYCKQTRCGSLSGGQRKLLEVTNKEYGNFTKALAKAATDPTWRHSPLVPVPVDRLAPVVPVPAALVCPPAYDSNHNDAIYQGHRKEVEPLSVTTVEQPLPAKLNLKQHQQRQHRPSELAKLLILMKRSNIQLYRDWTVTHLKLFVHIVCAIVIGLLFGDSGINATKSISNVASFMVHILYLWYTTLMPGVLKYPYEMNILKKESFNRWYKIRTYFVASMLTSLPVQIFFSIVYASIVYAMTYQPCELERYLMFTAVLVLNTIVADGFGLFLGTFLNEINGTFIGAIMTCFMFVFCGFLIMFSHMSDAMRGVSYLSSHRYSFEALVLTAYDDSRSDLVCPKDEMYCHYVKANTILRELGIVSGNYLFNVVTLVVHFVAIKVVGFWTLKRKLKMG
uniref:ABC-2 type transporter transmembrane domain-containing protein n=1 Tax=Anopheles dirus TaxID=7168 RepID=A0A182NGM4_9DIPT